MVVAHQYRVIARYPIIWRQRFVAILGLLSLSSSAIGGPMDDRGQTIRDKALRKASGIMHSATRGAIIGDTALGKAFGSTTGDAKGIHGIERVTLWARGCDYLLAMASRTSLREAEGTRTRW